MKKFVSFDDAQLQRAEEVISKLATASVVIVLVTLIVVAAILNHAPPK